MPLARAFVDGSARGRPPGVPRQLTVSRDGRSATFFVGDLVLTTTLFRLSLDDGAVTPIATLRGWSTVMHATAAEVLLGAQSSGAGALTYDLATGAEGRVALAPSSYLDACSPDGVTLAVKHFSTGAGPRSEVRVDLVRRGDGRALATLPGHPVVLFMGDGAHALALDVDGVAHAVDLRGDGGWEPFARLAHPNVPTLARVERGGRRALHLTHEGDATLVDPGARTVTRAGAWGRYTEVRDFAAGRALLACKRHGRRMFAVRDVETGDERLVDRDPGRAAALTPDGRAVLVFADPVFELHDVATGAVRTWHDGGEGALTALAWSRDGALLATRDARGVVRVLAPGQRAVVWTLEGPRGEPGALCFSADGRTLYAAAPRGFVAWDLATGAESASLTRLKQRAVSMAASDDGRLLALVGDDHVLRVVDVSATPRRVLSSTSMMRHPYHVTFDTLTAIRCLCLEAAAWRWPGNARAGRFVGAHCARWFDLEGREVESVPLALDAGPGVSVDDDLDTLLYVRADALIVAARVPGAKARTDRVVCTGLAAPRVLCAAGGVAVSEEGASGAQSLVARAITDGAELGRVDLTRRCVAAAMAPGGARVAVIYADGGVEVLAITRP
jgi:hypothetical protein